MPNSFVSGPITFGLSVSWVDDDHLTNGDARRWSEKACSTFEDTKCRQHRAHSVVTDCYVPPIGSAAHDKRKINMQKSMRKVLALC